MIIASGNSWLTTLADLSIILFMITAADLSNAQTNRENTPQQVASGAVATADPVAIYRPEAGIVPFKDWLATQPTDERQRVTILVQHRGTDVQSQIADGMAMARQAEESGHSPRMIVEQSNHSDVIAMLTYDTSSEAVAQKLLTDSQKQAAN